MKMPNPYARPMEPTITVEHICEACGGTGRIPEKRERITGGVQITPEGTCGVCVTQVSSTPGVIREKVSISGLKAMLDSV
jgi:hypothetical protein